MFGMGLKDILDNMKGQKPELDQAGQNQQRFEAALAAEAAKKEQQLAAHRAEVDRTKENARENAQQIEQQRPSEGLATRLDASQAREALTQKREELKTMQEMIADGKRPTPAREDYLKEYPRSRDQEYDR